MIGSVPLALPLPQFLIQLADSGLMSAAAAGAFIEALAEAERPKDGEQLARLLVKQKWLTSYQAQQIYAAKGKSLVLGNYLILDKLGQGGMGMVLKAEHRRMKRLVALKVLSPTVVKTKELLARFQREVQAAARLEHPNIVASYDADEANGTHFFVMQYVDGDDLSSTIKKTGPLPFEQAVNCVLQAARGLEFAHQQGVIHRDIKPANLLLDSKGTVKILDMGLARIEGETGAQAELTSTGAVMGTVDYMAPEQALSTKTADARSDIYSLGVTLWYLLNAKPLYDGDSLMARLIAHREFAVPQLMIGSPGLANPGLLGALNAVFQKMVAKKPAERYQSMTEVIAALEGLQRGPTAAPVGVPPQTTNSQFEAFVREVRANSVSGTRTAAAQPASLMTQAVVAGSEFAATITSASVEEVTDPQTLVSATGAGATRTSRNRKRAAQAKWWQDRRVQIGAGVAVLGVACALFMLSRQDRQVPAAPKHGLESKPTADTPPVETRFPAHETVPQNQFALEFDGVDDHVILPFGYDGKHPLTIECEVFITGFDDKMRTAISNSQDGGAKFELLRNVRTEKPTHWNWVTYCATQPDKVRAYSDAPAALGRWVHLAGVREGDSARFYVDGKLQQSAGHVKQYVASPWKFLIGANPTFEPGHPKPKADFCLLGKIRHVRFSNVARYADDYAPGAGFAPDANTMALYHFDEGTGNVLKDVSGKNQHGEIVGATWVRLSTVAQAKPAQFALEFDGIDDYVDIHRDWIYEGGPFTFEAWVVPKAPNPDAYASVLFSAAHQHGEDGHGLRVLRNLRRKSTGEPFGQIHLSNPPNADVAAFADQLRHEVLTHVAAVYDGVAVRWHVNGAPQERFSFNYVWPAQLSTAATTLGAYGNKDGWAGTMQQVRLSSSARYSERFTPPSDFASDAETISLYKFDEGSGDVLSDSSGHNRHGKIIGAKWVGTRTPPPAPPVVAPPPLPGGDYALAFVGGSFVEVPTLKLPRQGPLTIEAYVTPREVPKLFRHLIGIDQQFSLQLVQGGKWGAGIFANKGEKGYPLSSSTPVVAGQRVHLAVIWTGGDLTLCVDGKKVDSAGTAARRLPDATAAFTLGGKFVGDVDEVRVSKVARYRGNFKPELRFLPDEDTLALYHCDEGTGDVLRDSSGHNQHGRIIGAKWVFARAAAVLPNGRLDFDGQGNVVRIEKLTFDDVTQPVTVEGWVHPRSLSGKVDMVATLGGRWFLQSALIPGESDPRWMWIAAHAEANRFYSLNGPPIRVLPQQPVHLAGVYDGREMRFYIDGRRQTASPALSPEYAPTPNHDLPHPQPRSATRKSVAGQRGAVGSGDQCPVAVLGVEWHARRGSHLASSALCRRLHPPNAIRTRR